MSPSDYHSSGKTSWHWGKTAGLDRRSKITVIAVDSADKYSFVLKGVQTRRNDQCRIDPFASFVCQATDNDNSY